MTALDVAMIVLAAAAAAALGGLGLLCGAAALYLMDRLGFLSGLVFGMFPHLRPRTLFQSADGRFRGTHDDVLKRNMELFTARPHGWEDVIQ